MPINLKFRSGEKVTWKDGNGTMTGVVEAGFECAHTPNVYVIRVGLGKGARRFERYEPSLRKVSGA